MTFRYRDAFELYRWLYSLGMYLMTPVILYRLAWRGLRYREYLERWCAIWGINRKPGAPATGNVTFTLVDSSAKIPQGTLLQAPSGLQYTTLTQATVESFPYAQTQVQALAAGAAGNDASWLPLTVRPNRSTSSGVGCWSKRLTGTRLNEFLELMMDGALSAMIGWLSAARNLATNAS